MSSDACLHGLTRKTVRLFQKMASGSRLPSPLSSDAVSDIVKIARMRNQKAHPNLAAVIKSLINLVASSQSTSTTSASKSVLSFVLRSVNKNIKIPQAVELVDTLLASTTTAAEEELVIETLSAQFAAQPPLLTESPPTFTENLTGWVPRALRAPGHDQHDPEQPDHDSNIADL